MINRPDQVRAELRKKVDQGYCPYYSLESAFDHKVDWLVLTKEDFHNTLRAAQSRQEPAPGASSVK